MGAAGVLAALLVLPRFDLVKSARPLAQKLVALAGAAEPYAIYPRLDPRFVFHTRRYAETPSSEAELQAFAKRPGRVWLLITRPALAKLSAPLPLAEVARDAAREDGFVLLATPEAQPSE